MSAPGQTAADARDWLSIAEAAKRAGISRRLLEKRLAQGRLTYYRDGRRVLIRPDDLARYIESRKVPARRPS